MANFGERYGQQGQGQGQGLGQQQQGTDAYGNPVGQTDQSGNPIHQTGGGTTGGHGTGGAAGTEAYGSAGTGAHDQSQLRRSGSSSSVSTYIYI